jgi:hypothetical protein
MYQLVKGKLHILDDQAWDWMRNDAASGKGGLGNISVISDRVVSKAEERLVRLTLGEAPAGKLPLHEGSRMAGSWEPAIQMWVPDGGRRDESLMDQVLQEWNNSSSHHSGLEIRAQSRRTVAAYLIWVTESWSSQAEAS